MQKVDTSSEVELQGMLSMYVNVFMVPHKLPPSRENDHAINVKEGVWTNQCQTLSICPLSEG